MTRSIPPPIRHLELRDRLSERLGEALQAQQQVASLYLLRSFGRLVGARGRAEVSREAVIEAAEQVFREVGLGVAGKEVLGELLSTHLLEQIGDDAGKGRVVPGRQLLAELSSAISRAEAYCRALETLSRRPVHAAGEVEWALEEAVCLFNEGLFFEVHEVLEAVWLKQQGPSRLLLQGLIQIAVGFHHLENRNLSGALGLLKEGRDKVTRFGPESLGLRLDRFLEQVDECRRSIQSLGQKAFDRFDRRMIPHMQLLHRDEA